MSKLKSFKEKLLKDPFDDKAKVFEGLIRTRNSFGRRNFETLDGGRKFSGSEALKGKLGFIIGIVYSPDWKYIACSNSIGKTF